MARVRKIKQYGGSYAIKLEHSDLIDLKISVGDYVDIGDIIKVENG